MLYSWAGGKIVGMGKKSTSWKKRIDTLQGKLGLSNNREMAAYLGVSLGTLRSWKYGKRNPSATARRLIELLEELHASK